MKNKYMVVSILTLIAVISVQYYFSLNREFEKELIDESINSYGKDKLTVVKIKSDKYFKVSDILGGKDTISKDKISSGDYNNRIYMSLNSKKLFYYSTELNRNIEIDYSDFDKFYFIKNEELYINSKYFNLVSFGFTNQLIETETHYKYINNFYDSIEEEEKELKKIRNKKNLNYEEDFKLLVKAIEIYHPSLDRNKHNSYINKSKEEIIKSRYLGHFVENFSNYIMLYNNGHLSFENLKETSIEIDIINSLLNESDFKFSEEKELKYKGIKVLAADGEKIHENKKYKEAIKKNSLELFLKWMKEIKEINNFLLENGEKIYVDKTIEKIFEDNINEIEESEKELIKFKKLNKNTLLIDINSWMLKDLELLLEGKNVQDIKNIIIDLRNNGGGYAANVIDLLQFLINKRISAYTIKEGEIVNKKFSYTDNEGFYVTKEYIYPINNSDKKNIITLINENSYSSSNTFATLVKENNIGLLIGEKSGGGAYTPRYYYQENGNLLGIPSSFGLFSKEGYDYEYGVEPDIYVKDEIIDGKDMVLERALKELKNQ